MSALACGTTGRVQGPTRIKRCVASSEGTEALDACMCDNVCRTADPYCLGGLYVSRFEKLEEREVLKCRSVERVVGSRDQLVQYQTTIRRLLAG